MKDVKKKKYRVAIYCRVGNPNSDNTALKTQKEALRKYAEERGYAVVAKIFEKASGRSLDRNGIRELYDLAGQRAMDEVLAVGFSRYSRNVADMLCLRKGLEEQGIKLNALKEMSFWD